MTHISFNEVSKVFFVVGVHNFG
jgi:hypothetical protein